MGMLDGKPFVPRTGAPVLLNWKRYVLRWVPGKGRCLFSWPRNATMVSDIPTYVLREREFCEQDRTENCRHHFDVISLRTGKKYDEMTVYMVQVVEGNPTVKRPWWNDGRTSFQRKAQWQM